LRLYFLAFVMVSALAVVGLAACSSSSKATGTPVAVTLTDYKVSADPATVPAGSTTFTVQNNGSFVHEMLVVKADAVTGSVVLPDGTIDESKIESSIVDEAADIERAVAVLGEVGEALRSDPAWTNRITGAVEVLGVILIDPTGVTLRALCETEPAAQFEVEREFRLRVLQAFDNDGIPLAQSLLGAAAGRPGPGSA
jgi:hypothetical protein